MNPYDPIFGSPLAGPQEVDPISFKIDNLNPSPVDEMLARHLPHMIELFRSKARDYESEGVSTSDMLGARGQFAEIWRKVGKLKRCMWDGKPMQHEQPDEILEDLFGHIVLALDYLESEKFRCRIEEVQKEMDGKAGNE